MIRHTYKSAKVTANQFAKLLIEDALHTAEGYWTEKGYASGMTEKEVEEVKRHLSKHIASIEKKLGTYKI